MHRNDYIAIGLITITAAVTLAVWPSLPDPFPIHFDHQGRADGFAPMPWGPWILPGVMVLVYLLMRILPAISPKQFSMRSFQGAFEAVILSAIGFIGAIHLGILFDLLHLVPLALGVLFIIIGNYMSKTEPNFFFGIRTPWTLANSEVWARTHRLGGWMFVVTGIATIVAVPLGAALPVLTVSAVATALILVGYSFALYRRLEA